MDKNKATNRGGIGNCKCQYKNEQSLPWFVILDNVAEKLSSATLL